MKRQKNKPNSKKWDDMSVDEQARWLCLLEAVKVTSKYAERIGIDTEKSSKWIKPGAINQYISECFPSMHVRVVKEKQGYKQL